jgi:o-succinylbenzoate synthase
MRIYSYNIPLHPSPLPLSVRQGLIVQTETGWGEIAPLPGWSAESLLESIASLPKNPAPSAFFGCKSALLPFPASFPPIPLCALVSDFSAAKEAVSSGFRTLKIKIKNLSPLDALKWISSIRSPSVQLRIDINRSWPLKDALYFLQALDPDGIEYIEEPVPCPASLLELTRLPIALDETLLAFDAEKWIALPNISALVLKPTLLGARLSTLIAAGRKLGKKLIFSSSFESAIALLHIAHLQMRHAPENAAGIDTHRFFKANFLPFPVKNGFLCPDPLPPVDRTWLQNEFVL